MEGRLSSYAKHLFLLGSNNKNHYVRPKEVYAIINKEFERIAKKQSAQQIGYIFTGSIHYGAFVNGLNVTSSMILQSHLKDQKYPISVLDIGAGNFAFKRFNDSNYQGQVITYGISANDLHRLPHERVADEYHRFANAEYLSEIFGENKFDFIFSARTFMHFVDPIGALIEAYKSLKCGGFLIIDYLPIRGCKSSSAIIAYLIENGFVVLSNDSSDPCEILNCALNNLIIQKTKATTNLLLPVEFKEIKHNRIYYRPNSQLLLFSTKTKQDEKNVFERGKIVVLNEIELYPEIHSFLKNYKTISELITSQTYENLPSPLQHLTLLACVATDFCYEKYIELLNSCLNLTGLDKKAFLGCYECLKMCEHTILYTLTNEIYFSIASLPLKIKIIEIAAIEDLLRSGRQETTKMTLEKMNCPYAIPDYHFDAKISFTKIFTDSNNQSQICKNVSC